MRYEKLRIKIEELRILRKQNDIHVMKILFLSNFLKMSLYIEKFLQFD